jgi:hypothetical protein
MPSVRPDLRSTAAASAVIGVCGAAYSLHAEHHSATTFFGVLAIYGALIAMPRAPGGKTEQHRHDATCAAVWQAASGDYAAATRTVRGARSVHPALSALVAAVNDSNPAAIERLWQLHDESPRDATAGSCLMLWRREIGDWPGLVAMFSTSAFSVGAGAAAFDGAFRAGAFAEAASIGEALLRRRPTPEIAYNTACSWARAGDGDKALSMLQRAVEYGWTDWGHIDNDSDLAALHASPAFVAWRLAAQAASVA